MDENAFANDEYTQFMNGALVNGPNAFLPSFDLGAAVEWEISGFSLKGVVMAMGSNGEEGDLEEPYAYYGVQVAYTLDSALGQGNYRLILDTTSRDFSNIAGTEKERKFCALISFDQEFGKILGSWIRFGWADDKAAIPCKSVYSGGLNISGSLWGRGSDNLGIGYAHLIGGNIGNDHTDVFEAYARFALNDIFAVTGDVQYMKDSMDVGDSPDGWIFGLRMTAEF